MRHLFYKFAPVIIPSIGFSIWFVGRLLDEYTNIHAGLIWMPYVLIQCIISIICGKLLQNLYRGTYKDILTGLRNRRYFYERLSKELGRVSDYISLILLDVDDFKRINDKYGHVIGDRVLKELVKILQENCRSTDILARWGGDEFVIILPGTNMQGAYKLAERLRKSIQAHDFHSESITISIGIASINEKIDTDQFVVMADKALYRAKEKKNVVVVTNTLAHYVQAPN